MNKQQTIQYITELMATIQAAYFKGRMDEHPLRVHEHFDDSAAISIDLYNFEGDGKPVCDGLTFRLDDSDARQEPVTPFCICYDPDEQHPLVLLCTYDGELDDFDMTPDQIPESVLRNIATWLEQAMQPVPQKEKKGPSAKDIINLWNDWCMDYDEENLWLNYMADRGHCNRQHLQEKWHNCYQKYGNKAAMTMFWCQLDNTNREILTQYVTEVWHKELDF